jgi:hypothetical protein
MPALRDLALYKGQILPFADWVNSRAITVANTAEDMDVPDNAQFVILSGTADFVAREGTGLAVMPAADLNDGTSGELNITIRALQPGTTRKISLNSATAGCIVTGAFYK